MKKKIGIILALLMLGIVAVSGISAYFTATDTIRNTFTVGRVSIELIEPNWDGTIGTTPNETTDKDPQVVNNGDTDAYVFLEVVVPYGNVVTVNQDGTKNEQADTELFVYAVNNGWVEVGEPVKDDEDGVVRHVYAYVGDDPNVLKTLEDGQTTETLFDSITFANISEGQGYENSDLDVIINAYGIQTEISNGNNSPENVWNIIKNQIITQPEPYLLGGPSFNSSIPNGTTEVVFMTSEAPEGVNLIDVSDAQNESVVGWSDGNTFYVSSQNPWVEPIANIDSNAMFLNKTSITNIDMDELDTSRTENMQRMFANIGASYLDLSSLNTSNVSDMSGMCLSSEKLEVVDMTGLDTSSVTTMYMMFSKNSKTEVMSLKELKGAENFNTSELESTKTMFQGCQYLENIDVSDWDMTDVTDISYMFSNCHSLKGLDVSKWDTGKVNTMAYTFQNCKSLESLDVSNWKTENVTSTLNMFYHCESLKKIDVSKWNTGLVKNMKAMFDNCSSLENLDVSSWNTISVEDMSFLFHNCCLLETLDVSNWNTSKVTSMSSMFSCNNNDGKLVSLDMSRWNTQKVTNMGWMFYGQQELSTIDVSSFNTENVVSFHHMFAHCRNSKIVGYDTFNTGKVTTFNSMFNGTRNTSFDVSGYDTSNAVDFAQMFEGCSNAVEIKGLESFDTSKGMQFFDMFNSCSSLKELDLSSFDTTKADDNWVDPYRGYSSVDEDYSSMYCMLSGLESLEKITFGANFSFDGNGECVKPAVMSTPSVSGSDGKWYNVATKVGYLPENLPDDTAAEYSALPQ